MAPFDESEAVFAIDWLESAGAIVWSDDRRDEWERLRHLQLDALAAGVPVPLNLPECPCLLHPLGMGTGRQSRLEYRIELAHGVLLGLSSRKDASRRLQNFYLKVPGEACLLCGVDQVRQSVLKIVAFYGGELFDEWIRRIDVCLDLAGVRLQEGLLPAFERHQFLTTAPHWHAFDGKDGKTGFTIFSPKRVRCNVYDKRRQVEKMVDDTYQLAMVERRWFGKLPEEATRVEYQVLRPWFTTYGLDTVSGLLGDLGSLVAKLTIRGPHPFFWMTDEVPDRDNKHQGRASGLLLWERIAATFQQRAGIPRMILKPVKRGQARLEWYWRMMQGYLTKAGALMGVAVEKLEDAMAVLQRLHNANYATDQQWADKWEMKARKAGTYDKLLSFDPETFS